MLTTNELVLSKLKSFFLASATIGLLLTPSRSFRHVSNYTKFEYIGFTFKLLHPIAPTKHRSGTLTLRPCRTLMSCSLCTLSRKDTQAFSTSAIFWSVETPMRNTSVMPFEKTVCPSDVLSKSSILEGASAYGLVLPAKTLNSSLVRKSSNSVRSFHSV